MPQKKEQNLLLTEEGKLIFIGNNPARSEFRFDPEYIISPPTVDFKRSVLPADFDHERYEVTGTYRFKLFLKEKKSDAV